MKKLILISTLLAGLAFLFTNSATSQLQPLTSKLKPLAPLSGKKGTATKNNGWLERVNKERARNIKIALIRKKNIERKKIAGFAGQEGLASWYGPGFQGKKLAPDFIARGTIPVRITPLSSKYGFIWPTTDKTITQYPSDHGYQAIDIRGSWGVKVWAVASGTVIYSGWKNGYGNCIQIDHGAGLSSFYAHLSRRMVRTGQRIRQGQIIGLIGSTGRASGPHLHFEIRQNGRKKNPLNYSK